MNDFKVYTIYVYSYNCSFAVSNVSRYACTLKYQPFFLKTSSWTDIFKIQIDVCRVYIIMFTYIS